MTAFHTSAPQTPAPRGRVTSRVTSRVAFTADAPNDHGDERRRSFAAAAAARLGPVCADWPPEQFATLIADVVQFHERWSAWDAGE